MRILVTNDDGIYAPGLWSLVRELKNIGKVMVVAPDREQSATGASITLHHPLRVQRIRPEVSGVESYTVGGTPGDCAIMAICHLAGGKLDLCVSGVNNGPNIGVDVFQSGTVGGALQGYLHGLSAIAVSVDEIDSAYIDIAAKFTALMVSRLEKMPETYLFNVNLPAVSVDKIKGIRISRLSTACLADTVEEGHDGRRRYYWLKYQKLNTNVSSATDDWAVSRHYISISPLHRYLFGKTIYPNGAFTGLLPELQQQCRKHESGS